MRFIIIFKIIIHNINFVKIIVVGPKNQSCYPKLNVPCFWNMSIICTIILECPKKGRCNVFSPPQCNTMKKGPQESSKLLKATRKPFIKEIVLYVKHLGVIENGCNFKWYQKTKPILKNFNFHAKPKSMSNNF